VSSKIKLHRESFIQNFLSPVSRLADNVPIFFTEEEIYTVCANQDGSVVLLASYNVGNDKSFKINLPDIKKFVRLLDCIEDEELLLDVESNYVNYETDSVRFKYFLLEESYIQRCPATPEKIKQLQYDTTFDIPIAKLNEILKGSTITTDSDKLYLYTRDKKIYAELNDRERQNINSITYLVTDVYEGNALTACIPFTLENIRLLSGLRTNTFSVKVNNKLKVALFEIKNNYTTIKFVISALVK
jgi:hypothetical protein